MTTPRSSLPRPLATLILAGGKGTRMGSSDRHKSCFEVLGIPVRARDGLAVLWRESDWPVIKASLMRYIENLA